MPSLGVKWGVDSILTAVVALLRVWYELGFSSFSNGFEPQDIYRRMLRTWALAFSQSTAVLLYNNWIEANYSQCFFLQVTVSTMCFPGRNSAFLSSLCSASFLPRHPVCYWPYFLTSICLLWELLNDIWTYCFYLSKVFLWTKSWEPNLLSPYTRS